MSDETNIEYIGIYLQVLSLIKDYKEADSVISKHGITLEKAVGNEALISVMVSIFIGKKDFDS